MADAMIDVNALVAALDATRRQRGLSWRKLAEEADVSPSTLTRMQQGKSPDVNTFAALTQWLNMAAENFTKAQHGKAEEPEVLAVVSTLLRGKKKMSPKAIHALQELVEAAFKLSKELHLK